MGSDKHYSGRGAGTSRHWRFLDRLRAGDRASVPPMTDRQFKQFIRATCHKTFAEISDPKNYPGALPQMLYAGSLVFTPPRHPVHLKNFNPGNARGTVKRSYNPWQPAAKQRS